MSKFIDLNTLPKPKAERVLFIRLFRNMMGRTPRVPITVIGASLVRTWRNEILAGGVQEHAFGTWGRLFANIDWERPRKEYNSTCGAHLLQFLGHYGEAMHRFGPAEIPLDLALMAMINCDLDVSLMRLTCDDAFNWNVRLKPRAEWVLRLAGEVALAERMPLFDVPQELFENYFVGEVARAPVQPRRRQQDR